MSDAHPVQAAPRALLELLSRAAFALLDPVDPAPRPRRPGAGIVPERYAGFDAPTYQRRRLRIAGLECEQAAVPVQPAPPDGTDGTDGRVAPGVRARARSTRPASRPRA